MQKEFVNLKVHSQFSICEGAVKIQNLASYCSENSISAVGISDTSNMSGSLEFANELIKNGTQPIIGTQVYFKQKIQGDFFYGKISFIAKNEKGYKNLLKISSKSYLDLEESDDLPSLFLQDLKDYSSDLIILIGGSNSFFSNLLIKNHDEFCKNEIEKLKNLFLNNIYIEIQRHGESHE
ncbi:MAG: PHP domain-containing protein, partial [Pelagibacteraceae bacterium]